MYQIFELVDGNRAIRRSAEHGGGIFLMDDSNPDYREYLAWIAEGNTPEEWNPDTINGGEE